ncbi:glycoside hydrolase family 2 TIM barrel-domain containing protein [Paenibacillus sp. HB172176]|uniref:glycoside hydrolase family 2 TIM barrel-domain containing protein n=1 Tax=Paenibacillus sp. HB172176 TaxID=2493690 RepID=UPI00143B68E4|nr:glycoside hydrolase family 2 TIM barrel-domain containing protein [Paenibacillus sp. HB172176]
MNQITLFNNDWQFSKLPLHSDLETAAGGSIDWTPVTVPHDWMIYQSHDLYESGEGWYRKRFELGGFEPGTRFSLRFEGVYMNSTIYVNGQEAGAWKYGYSTFEIDITPFAHSGMNELYVRVVHESPNSRWYSGAGIYRSVWLKAYPNTHIAADGIYIAAAQENGSWYVETETEVVFAAGRASDLASGAAAAHGAEEPKKSASTLLALRHHVTDAEGRIVAQATMPVPTPASAGAIVSVPVRIPVEQPELWDIERPYCYKLTTQLMDGENIIMQETNSFGFRTIAFDSERGFFLNGRHVKLHGVCQHHDLGCLGAAVNKAALRRQIALLREMGVNAIRTAHNMPAVELMELADEMGILIVSEAFDMWERKKTTYDYARFFPEWWRRDIASWVRRDRNHPSMLMWSIGNEIYDTHADERGQELTWMLMDEVLLHDPKGNAVITIGSNYMPWENARKCADIVKFAGYNYAEKYYDQHHAEHPHWIIYGSETSSTVQSRGIYHFPLSQSVLADDDEQCSSLGNSSTSWGAKSTESCIIADRDATYSPGQFLWTGFDYIGEPTPYHTKNSYFGQLDTAGFKKDAFYIYQAEWTDYRVSPMIHIFPYWDFSNGQLIDVRVCSNAPKIELFLNEKSLGIVHIDHARGQRLIGEWRIPYEEGVLRAAAYDEAGKEIASDIRSSFGDAAAIALSPDRTTLTADGVDLIFVEISAVDSDGHPVENANNRVLVTVDGPGRLVGLDNGDSTDYDSYKGASRRLFSGKLLAVIAASLEPGSIRVRVASRGLQAGELALTALAPQPADDAGVKALYLYDYRAFEEHPASPIDGVERDEIPVRKLEIICPEGNRLSPENRSLPLRVKLHPDKATFQEVEWRVTNAAGIDANIAALEANGHDAVITALGDGDIYIRCATKNGAERTRLYSLMEFHISGLGQTFLNPYEFVSAGYHSSASRNLTNGNERGIATARDGESLICFSDIDFGSYGSDEVTLPIFALDSEEFPIEIWRGVPGEDGGELLTTVAYQRPSRWNVYQEETYRLPERLKGVCSLSFVLRRKIHLKGFKFAKRQKAFTRLSALDNDHIYGDSFTRSEQAIEGIGNNVSLIYEDMDFGDGGSTRVVICGHSPLDKNTIHLLFSGPQGESKQLVEFAYSEGYCERAFQLEHIAGLQTVILVFLPGSQFDLKWFQFEK